MAISTGVGAPFTFAQFSNPITTNTFSPPAGTTLVALVGDVDTGTEPIYTISNSGTSLTWTVRKRYSNLAIYTAYNANAQSSITVSFASNGPFGDARVFAVFGFTGVSPTVPVGNTASNFSTDNFAQPFLYTSSVANSRCVYFANDLNGTGLPEAPPGTEFQDTWSFASGSGATSSGIYGYKASNTAASTNVYGSFNAFSTASPVWTWAAVELLPDTGQAIVFTGIASGEAVGTPQLNLVVSPSGITSGEAVGTPTLELQNLILFEGIASGESVGTPTLVWNQTVSLTGVPSEETFGSLNVQLGYPQTVILEGVESGESVGQGPSVKLTSRMVFRPPTVQEQPAARDILLERFGIHRGITVIKRLDGTFYETRYPDQVTVEESSRVYWGGHVNEISVSESTALTVAGYGSYITTEVIT